MKKFFKVLGIILLILVVLAAAVIAWQWKYVSAVIDGLRYDDEALAQKAIENTEQAISGINEEVSVELREMTQEEKDKIASGELSQSAVMAQILAEAVGLPLPDPAAAATEGGEAGAAAPEQTAPAGGAGNADNPAPPAQSGEAAPKPQPQDGGKTPAKDESPSGSESASGGSSAAAPTTSDQYIAAAVSKLYALQSQYTGQIEGLISSAGAYYREQKAATNSEVKARANTISNFANRVPAMEAACDAQVEAVISELTGQLNSIGADPSGIVAKIRNSYESEKESQRASYSKRLSKYL